MLLPNVHGVGLLRSPSSAAPGGKVPNESWVGQLGSSYRVKYTYYIYIYKGLGLRTRPLVTHLSGLAHRPRAACAGAACAGGLHLCLPPGFPLGLLGGDRAWLGFGH